MLIIFRFFEKSDRLTIFEIFSVRTEGTYGMIASQQCDRVEVVVATTLAR